MNSQIFRSNGILDYPLDTAHSTDYALHYEL